MRPGAHAGYCDAIEDAEARGEALTDNEAAVVGSAEPTWLLREQLAELTAAARTKSPHQHSSYCTHST